MFQRKVKKGPKHLPNSLIFTEEWRFYDHNIKFTKIIGPSFSFVNKEYNNYQLYSHEREQMAKLKQLQNYVAEVGQ